MISIDEIALVKDRVTGKHLSVAGVASLRQLEVLFLVAHDEVQRLEKFEDRARLVADKWELISSATLIAKTSDKSSPSSSSTVLPSGFSSVVTSNDRARCRSALEMLYGPDSEVIASLKSKRPDDNNNNINNPGDSVPSPIKKVATPKKKRNPEVYVDDEFSYINDDDQGSSAHHNNNNNISNTLEEYYYSRETSPQHPNNSKNKASSPSSSATSSPTNNNNKNNRNMVSSSASPLRNDSTNEQQQQHESANYLDTLACCKFISAIPKVVFELAFHREGEYASVALAAALDEVKLFESQLRSSQESFQNLQACWNHELKILSRESGEDLLEARIVATHHQEGSVAGSSSNNKNDTVGAVAQHEQRTIAHNTYFSRNQQQSTTTTTASNKNVNDKAIGVVTTSSSAPVSLDQLAPCESADGQSWLAPPLLPLHPGFSVNSHELFAGYCGPTLLGPVVSRGVLYDQIANLIMNNLESDETSKRAQIAEVGREETVKMLLARSCEAEAMWKQVIYEKTAMNLRLLESKEEARKLRNQVNAVGFESL